MSAVVEDELERCPHCGLTHPASILRCPDTDITLPLAGRLLDGRFRLLECIGRGGMASVWLARNERVDRRVAIKLIRADVARDEGLVARFRAEARAAGRIGNPNICDILDSGRSPIGPYIVMELLEGQSLGDLLAGGNKLPAPVAVMIVREALRGLQAAHRAGIVHRDLKPENIFLHRPEGAPPMVKLMDFGVAKFTDGSGEARTEHGALLGTPEYMAPEQFRGATFAEARTDIWAMGAILYRAITGTNAFGGPTVAATLLMVASENPRPCLELAPDTPPALADVIHRCLQKDLARRFADVAELDAALAPFDAPTRDESVFEGGRVARVEPERVSSPSDPDAASSGGFGHARTRQWSGPSDAPSIRSASGPNRTVRRKGRTAATIAVVSLVGFVVWRLRATPDAAAESNTAAPSAASSPDATASPDAEGRPEATTERNAGGMDPVASPGPVAPLAEVPEPQPASEPMRPSVPPPPPPRDESLVESPSSPTGSTDPAPADAPPTDPPVPDPSGVVRVGRWIALSHPGPAGTLHAASEYCEGLAGAAHLGIRKWELPNPAIAAKFVGAKGVRKGRYWTSALWRGNAITIAMPSGEKRSIAATETKPRVLCVARWP